MGAYRPGFFGSYGIMWTGGIAVREWRRLLRCAWHNGEVSSESRYAGGYLGVKRRYDRDAGLKISRKTVLLVALPDLLWRLWRACQDARRLNACLRGK